LAAVLAGNRDLVLLRGALRPINAKSDRAKSNGWPTKRASVEFGTIHQSRHAIQPTGKAHRRSRNAQCLDICRTTDWEEILKAAVKSTDGLSIL